MFREADLIVMPTCTEGFGLTALEATSAGVPVNVSSFNISNINKWEHIFPRQGVFEMTLSIDTFWFPSQRDLHLLNYKTMSRFVL